MPEQGYKEILKNSKTAVVGFSLSIIALAFITGLNFIYKFKPVITSILPILLPILLFILLIFVYKKRKKLYIILNIIFYIIWICAALYGLAEVAFSSSETTTDIRDYKKFLFITSNDSSKFDYFPREIPKNAENVFFYGRTSAFFVNPAGILIYDTSEEEIEKYKTEYSDNIVSVDIAFSAFSDMVLNLGSDYEMSDWSDSNFKVMIIREYRQTLIFVNYDMCDGILINEDTNQIIFFTDYILKSHYLL